MEKTELKISKEHDLVVKTKNKCNTMKAYVLFSIGQGIEWHFLWYHRLLCRFHTQPVNSAHRDLEVGRTCTVLLCGKLSPAVS